LTNIGECQKNGRLTSKNEEEKCTSKKSKGDLGYQEHSFARLASLGGQPMRESHRTSHIFFTLFFCGKFDYFYLNFLKLSHDKKNSFCKIVIFIDP